MRSLHLGAAGVEARLARGDRLRMELRAGQRQWWFEDPYAIVSDRTIAKLLAADASLARVIEAGDSLFGLPMNSQTWISAPSDTNDVACNKS